MPRRTTTSASAKRFSDAVPTYIIRTAWARHVSILHLRWATTLSESTCYPRADRKPCETREFPLKYPHRTQCFRNFCCRYGLTCRQGLAPCSSLQQAPEDAVRSPIHGYVTQRGERTTDQRLDQQGTPSKLSLPSDDSVTQSRVQPAHSGLSAGGFATDRPSPSAQRLRYGAPISSTSNASSGTLASRSPVGMLVLDARTEAKSEAIALSPSNGAAVAPRDAQGQHVFASTCDIEANKTADNPVYVNRPQALERRHVSGHAPHESQRSRHDNGEVSGLSAFIQSAAAPATPERLHGAMSRANAALAASDALSREFSIVRSPSDVGANHSGANHSNSSFTKEIKLPASPSQGLCQSQKPRSLALVSSDDSDSSASSSSQCGAEDVLRQLHANLGIQPAIVSPARLDTKEVASAVFSVTIPASVNTAPIMLVRRGSSNSSSGSSNGRKLDVTDDSAISESHKLQPQFYVDDGRSVAALQRQKLRSGVGALRPTSAGGARKSVRPDLASGLGFKTVDVTSRKSTDAVRVHYSSCPPFDSCDRCI